MDWQCLLKGNSIIIVSITKPWIELWIIMWTEITKRWITMCWCVDVLILHPTHHMPICFYPPVRFQIQFTHLLQTHWFVWYKHIQNNKPKKLPKSNQVNQRRFVQKKKLLVILPEISVNRSQRKSWDVNPLSLPTNLIWDQEPHVSRTQPWRKLIS